MIPKEILKKVKKIELTTRHIVNDVFAGEYHSVFKGRGMEFAEVREYQIGDDIRTIDWNVTARQGQPFVKIFNEERELTVMLLVDASSSGEFGTVDQMKGEIATEICALLAFSAIKNNDKVGLIIFTDKVEKYVPPKKGKQHVLRVIRELLYFQPEDNKTNISCALEHLSHVIKRKSIVFLVSDFIGSDYEKSLRVARQKHDLVAVTVTDPRELSLPDIGFVELEDAETGELMLVDTAHPAVREMFASETNEEKNLRIKMFRSLNIDSIDIMTDRPYIKPIIDFFKKRASRH
ncbi:MAG: DUF58 domain-containing protein [Candidatus Cloacimonetes bacterium 4572_55]|nr:MAG: DUF58 domain-containing protein [Candidatus Cloacimonetes bacterium 4572_55]